MTHEEFILQILKKDFTPEEINRLAVEKAIIPASWCRKILEAIPEARGYLKRRIPEAMKQLEKAERQEKAAGRPRTP